MLTLVVSRDARECACTIQVTIAYGLSDTGYELLICYLRRRGGQVGSPEIGIRGAPAELLLSLVVVGYLGPSQGHEG